MVWISSLPRLVGIQILIPLSARSRLKGGRGVRSRSHRAPVVGAPISSAASASDGPYGLSGQQRERDGSEIMTPLPITKERDESARS